MQEMMPGKILVRAIRVDQTMYTNENVKAARARDKILSMFEESRQSEVGLRRDWALPCHTCAGTELAPATSLRPDWANPGHICAGTGLTPPTSARGLPVGSLLPHLRRDCAHPCHISARGAAHICAWASGMIPSIRTSEQHRTCMRGRRRRDAKVAGRSCSQAEAGACVGKGRSRSSCLRPAATSASSSRADLGVLGDLGGGNPSKPFHT